MRTMTSIRSAVSDSILTLVKLAVLLSVLFIKYIVGVHA